MKELSIEEKAKRYDEQTEIRCSLCNKWGCTHRNLKTDKCDLGKYDTHTTNKI